MNVSVKYRTSYTYEEEVSFSPHLFRLIPRAGRHVKVREFAFSTNPTAVINWRRDLFDNEIASVFYPDADREMTAALHLRLDVEPQNAFDFLLESRALTVPFRYDELELRVLAPFLSSDSAPALPFWSMRSSQPTLEMLRELIFAIHRNFTYERRDEGNARTSAETVATGSGACRDFTVLLVDVLRGMQLAARPASGYLCEFGDGEKLAEGALHAWVEVYLPGAGWVGLDPTNGTFCDHHHLTAATGLTMEDIAPITGTYYAPRPIAHEMKTDLEITLESAG